MRSKGPQPKAVPPQPVVPRAQGEGPIPPPAGGGGPPARGGSTGPGGYKNLLPPGLPLQQGPGG